MSYRSVPLDEPGVAGAANSFQPAVQPIHYYPFVGVVERTLEPVTDFQFPKHGTECQPHQRR